jgi:putative tricarboxylic transport membrane protein
VMLIGLFSGGIYGACITSILVGIPGTPAGAATILDGYTMNKNGQAGKAMGMAVIASWFGGTIGALIMTFASPQIAKVALEFGPPEFFALAFFGLGIIVTISGKSLLKGVIAGVFGLMLPLVGFDPLSGAPRFTFGSQELLGGITLIPALIGLFGYSQVFQDIEKILVLPTVKTELKNLTPRWSEIKGVLPTMVKSSIIGSFIGAVPGTGTDIAAFVSYGEAKRVSKHPERFGTGILEGVAAPESGNNACCGGAMVPMLTLGVPGDAVTAVLMGALTIHNFQPGPMLFHDHPEVVYPIFAAMILSQFVMLFVGLGGAQVFARAINIDRRILTPIIFLLCVVGSYSMRFSFFDVGVSLIIGVIAYFMNYYGFPGSPILLAIILGPMVEQNMRRSLLISRGDPTIFLTRPISAGFIIVGILMMVTSYYRVKKAMDRDAALAAAKREQG